MAKPTGFPPLRFANDLKRSEKGYEECPWCSRGWVDLTMVVTVAGRTYEGYVAPCPACRVGAVHAAREEQPFEVTVDMIDMGTVRDLHAVPVSQEVRSAQAEDALADWRKRRRAIDAEMAKIGKRIPTEAEVRVPLPTKPLFSGEEPA